MIDQTGMLRFGLSKDHAGAAEGGHRQGRKPPAIRWPITASVLNPSNMEGIVMHHRSLSYPWSYLAVPLFVLCACVPPQPYENISHINYGATKYSADLAQCRHRNATTVAITQGNYVQSGVGVDEVRTNAFMAAQGWQQAPPSVTGIIPL
jgi:hypothetical protein